VGLAIAIAALAEAGWRRVLAAGPATTTRPSVQLAGFTLGGLLVTGALIVDVRAAGLWRDEVGFWTRAVEQYPSEGAYHHSLGAARLRAGDLSGAQTAFVAAARVDPSLPRVDFNLGVVYTKLGRYPDAIAAYERALARDSTDVKALANLGALYERVGDLDRAVRTYALALVLDPGLAPIRRSLARLSASRGAEPSLP
jgi:tetratricopeptide (TPR) repeat protein